MRLGGRRLCPSDFTGGCADSGFTAGLGVPALPFIRSAALATGNSAFVVAAGELRTALEGAPPAVLERLTGAESVPTDATFAAALIEGDDGRVRKLTEFVATLPGPLVPVQAASPTEIADDANAFCLNWLLEEVSISINTAAAGSNASLMTIA